MQLTSASGGRSPRAGSLCLAAAVGLALLTCLALPALAAATQYYVDPSNPRASDGNPGTADQPFKNVAAAAQVLKPGDTLVYVGGGGAAAAASAAATTPPAAGSETAATSSGGSSYLVPAIIGAAALVVVVIIIIYFRVLQPRRRRKILLEALAIVERDERTSFPYAEELLNKALVSGLTAGDVADARFALAWIRAMDNKLAEAAGTVAELVGSGDKSPETAYLDLWLAAKREEHDHVEGVYELHGHQLGDLLDTKLIVSIAFLALARLRWSHQKIDGARDYFERVRALGVLADRVPSGIDDHQVMLGVQALFVNDTDEARRHFTGSAEAAREAGRSSLLGELGVLLCDWREDDLADIDDRLGEIAAALDADLADAPAPAGGDDETEQLSDDQLLVRGALLWHAMTLIASWHGREKGSGLPDGGREELDERLERVKQVDPEMGDPHLIGGLIGYYFAADDEHRRPAIELLEAARDRDVNLAQVIDLINRERKLDKLAEQAVQTFLELARQYVGDEGIPEALRAKLRERLGRHAQFGSLSEIEIERSQTDTFSVVEIIHERAKVMEDNVRRIVHGRLREHPEDAALLNELLAALQERTQALAEVAESVDGTGLELMSATGEFLLAEEEVLPDGGDREGAET